MAMLSTKLKASAYRLSSCITLIQELCQHQVPIHKPECLASVFAWCCQLLNLAAQNVGHCRDTEELLKRCGIVEESALLLRFELEEWGTIDPYERINKLQWHAARINYHLMWLFHRGCRLSKVMELEYNPHRRSNGAIDIPFDAKHPIQDPTMQALWTDYFGDHYRQVWARDFFGAMQNELRGSKEKLLTHQDIRFLSSVIGAKGEEVIASEEVDRFIKFFGSIGQTRDQKAAMISAMQRANENVRGPEGVMEPWFHPFINYTTAYLILSNASPFTFVVRYSSIPGCLVINWVANSRQVKSARIYSTAAGFAWREIGYRVVYSNIREILTEMRDFLRQPMILPQQQPSEGFLPPLPDED